MAAQIDPQLWNEGLRLAREQGIAPDKVRDFVMNYSDPSKSDFERQMIQNPQVMQDVTNQVASDLGVSSFQSPESLRPDAPQFESLVDPSTGQLRSDLSYNPETYRASTYKVDNLSPSKEIQGYKEFGEFALGTGPSEYATAAEEALDLRTMFERDQINKEANTSAAMARNQLAMRGGASSGARERVATAAQQQGDMGKANLRGTQLMGIKDILQSDALNRQSALQNFTQLGTNVGLANQAATNQALQFKAGAQNQAAQFNASALNQGSQYNIGNILQEIANERNFDLSKYDSEITEWAANQRAEEERGIAQQSGNCFAYGTLIDMEDGSQKDIQDIMIGDMVKDGGEVTALYVSTNKNPVYNYSGVLVTGEHAVLENGKFVRVKDSDKAFITRATVNLVFDFCTVNHRIVSQGIVFADYAETDNANETFEESLDGLNKAL